MNVCVQIPGGRGVGDRGETDGGDRPVPHDGRGGTPFIKHNVGLTLLVSQPYQGLHYTHTVPCNKIKWQKSSLKLLYVIKSTF